VEPECLLAEGQRLAVVAGAGVQEAGDVQCVRQAGLVVGGGEQVQGALDVAQSLGEVPLLLRDERPELVRERLTGQVVDPPVLAQCVPQLEVGLLVAVHLQVGAAEQA
jgi:hypothetical protein